MHGHARLCRPLHDGDRDTSDHSTFLQYLDRRLGRVWACMLEQQQPHEHCTVALLEGSKQHFTHSQLSKTLSQRKSTWTAFEATDSLCNKAFSRHIRVVPRIRAQDLDSGPGVVNTTKSSFTTFRNCINDPDTPLQGRAASRALLACLPVREIRRGRPCAMKIAMVQLPAIAPSVEPGMTTHQAPGALDYGSRLRDAHQ